MKIENFVKTINEVKEKNKLDLSVWEDLSVGLMNLVSLEEHSFFSYIKTHNEKFLAILENVREMRKDLLRLIVKDDDGSEKWCMSKHFLSSSMRLFEVGNRMLHEGKKEEADKFYKDSAELYAMFWKLNVGAIENNKGIKIEIKNEEKKGIFNSIKKLLECCRE